MGRDGMPSGSIGCVRDVEGGVKGVRFWDGDTDGGGRERRGVVVHVLHVQLDLQRDARRSSDVSMTVRRLLAFCFD